MIRSFTKEEYDALIEYLSKKVYHRIKIGPFLNIDEVVVWTGDSSVEMLEEQIDKYKLSIIDKEAFTLEKIDSIYKGVTYIDDSCGLKMSLLSDKVKELSTVVSTLTNKMEVRSFESRSNYLLNSTEHFEREMDKIIITNVKKIENSSFIDDLLNDSLYNLIFKHRALARFESEVSTKIEFDILPFLGGCAVYGLGSNGTIEEWAELYIPQYVNDNYVLVFMTVASVMLDYEDTKRHYYSNLNVWRNSSLKYKDSKGEYIEWQSEMTDIYFGRNWINTNDHTADWNACEVIAIYNAFVALGDDDPKHDFPELLATFESRGLTLYGEFGTSPVIIEEYLIEEGYNVETISAEDINDDKKVEDLQNEYETFIVTVYNDKEDITKAIHTMSVTCETVDDNGNKTFSIHNVYDENVVAKKYDSIKSSVKAYENNAKIINIIGIKKGEN